MNRKKTAKEQKERKKERKKEKIPVRKANEKRETKGKKGTR